MENDSDRIVNGEMNENNNGNNEEKKEEMTHWEPVGKDPYDYAPPAVKRHHEDYMKMWKIREDR